MDTFWDDQVENVCQTSPWEELMEPRIVEDKREYEWMM